MCSFEATQFLISDKTADASAWLLLWQLALTGNLDCIGFEPKPTRLALLTENLQTWYPPDSEVILYPSIA